MHRNTYQLKLGVMVGDVVEIGGDYDDWGVVAGHLPGGFKLIRGLGKHRPAHTKKDAEREAAAWSFL